MTKRPASPTWVCQADGKDLTEKKNQESMKTGAIILITSLMTLTALATLEMLFPGYDWLKEHSPDIIIARCPDMPPPSDRSITGTVRLSNIKIITALKGTNKSESAILRSDCWLREGEFYLIFGRCENGICEATEDFRVVPLERESWSDWVSTASTITNSIAGKTLDEQLQILFRQRIANLNREIQKDEKEKKRLETFIQQ